MRAGGLAESEQASVAPVVAPAAPLPSRPGGTDSLPGPVADPGAPRPRVDAPLVRAAREGADMVGDACVVWRVADDGRRLEPAATHHRDSRLRHALEAFLHQATFDPASHWPGQVVRHGAPVRLRKARLIDMGVDTGVGMRRAHALLVPVLDGGRVVAVAAVLRETREPEYSLREEVILRRTVGKVMAGASKDLGRALHAAGTLTFNAPPEPAGVDVGGGGGGDHDHHDDRGGRGGGGGDDDGGMGEGPEWGARPNWLMEHVGVGVWITDRDGVTTYVNNAMTALLGVPSPTLIGRPMGELLDDVPQMVRGEYCTQEERCDRRVTQPDGRHVWLEMTSSPLIDDQGRRRGTVNTAIDVTERKKVELAARQRVPRAHRRL
jgi:PAS domain S-box-containing protein